MPAPDGYQRVLDDQQTDFYGPTTPIRRERRIHQTRNNFLKLEVRFPPQRRITGLPERESSSRAQVAATTPDVALRVPDNDRRERR